MLEAGPAHFKRHQDQLRVERQGHTLAAAEQFAIGAAQYGQGIAKAAHHLPKHGVQATPVGLRSPAAGVDAGGITALPVVKGFQGNKIFYIELLVNCSVPPVRFSFIITEHVFDVNGKH